MIPGRDPLTFELDEIVIQTTRQAGVAKSRGALQAAQRLRSDHSRIPAMIRQLNEELDAKQ